MFRLSIIISVFLASFILSYEEGATSSFIPGANIAMTGSNNSVRFDIASDLYDNGSTATAPALTTTTKTFTGAFYGSGIGWIEFSTGTYQVSLDCGGQYLSGLTMDCILSGTGWSENVGDIYFSSGSIITYNPNTGYLSGSAISFVGDIDLTGIALPILPVKINETNIIANHNANITVSGASIYNGGNAVWNINVTPLATADTRSIIGNNGIFDIDLSLASTYDVSIADTNGSQTVFTLTVDPSIPAKDPIGGTYYANAFCIANSSDIRCPDGADRVASLLEKSPSIGSVIANGTDTYNLIMKTRDGYGNRISSGSIAIKYITTVKNIQTVFGDNLTYLPSNDGDAFVSSDLIYNYFGSSALSTVSLGAGDITYSIASSAPTNTTDNIIKLDSITYISGSTNTIITPTNISPLLTFIPLFTVSTDSVNTPVVNAPNMFTGTVMKNDPTSVIVPKIVTTLKIGPGTNSVWTGITSDPSTLCTNYYLKLSTEHDLCRWTDTFMSSIVTDTDTRLIFTGTYSPIAPFTLIEPTTIGTYVYYPSGSTDILYPLPNKIINGPTLTIPRIRVLGQTSNGMGIGSQNRTSIINSLRENISILARNRSSYSGSDFLISNGDININNATFTDKRAIISIGGDITITSNISIHDHPLVIIALTDTNNNGGNIIIDPAVTDIHSTIIAEHGITSTTSTSQLYVHGSMISSNPPQEIIPTSCPYFAPSCSDISDYDLPFSREGFTNPSIGGLAYPNSLVVEYDTRLIGDPPPAMNK